MYLISYPDIDNTNIDEYFTESEAIADARNNLEHTRGICYLDDQDALDDFIVVNWATKVL